VEGCYIAYVVLGSFTIVLLMLRNTFQQQYISIFNSEKGDGANVRPLQMWRVVSDNEASAVQYVQDNDLSGQGEDFVFGWLHCSLKWTQCFN
jgi:hypothetical protein